MSQRIDMSKRVYDKLTVTTYAGLRKGKAFWNAICACGNTVSVSADKLRRGLKTNCGCVKKMPGTYRHGYSHTPTHNTWQHMLDRCYNQCSNRYAEWGGRGISVCERWHTFENFLEDMGEKPAKGLSIHRVNNDGNYEPGNCVWANAKIQNNAKRDNVVLTVAGETRTAPEWSAITGINSRTITARKRKGWSDKECVQPLLRKKSVCLHFSGTLIQ